MANIFISYRREDSSPWAGRLHTDLTKQFGDAAVFMDTQAGIRAGEKFGNSLEEQLASCKVLLALIGPQWLTLAHSRTQPISEAENQPDWVEKEIITALHRDVLVIPVMLGGCEVPQKEQLPKRLQPLFERNTAPLQDATWNEGLLKLISDITATVPLSSLVSDDMASAIGGIQLLKSLVQSTPTVAEAVGRSREVVENTVNHLTALANLKKIHDAFHQIEFLCFRPLKGISDTVNCPCVVTRLDCIRFSSHQKEIEQTIALVDMNGVFREEITDQLNEVSTALKDALHAKDESSVERTLAEMSTLIASVPPQIDTAIVSTAANLNLPRLVELMSQVGDNLQPLAGSTADAELRPFLAAINAMARLKDTLTEAVRVHSQLQILDATLRSICNGGAYALRLEAEWRRVGRLRSRIAPNAWGELAGVLDELAGEIDAAVQCDANEDVIDLFNEYLQCVSIVFKTEDTRLKEFCDQLNGMSHPLKTVLEMC